MSAPASDVHLERELDAFIGIVRHYFLRVGGSAPEMLTAELEWQPSPRLAKTGYMIVGGLVDGWVAISLPDAMLLHLLERLGEPLRDEAALLDLSAEMASVITSNARAHFGERLRVAPPVAVRHTDPDPALGQPGVCFKLPFRWQQQEGFLRIALLSAPAGQPSLS